MLHANRRFSVRNVETAEQLAEMLHERSWCLCQGFRHGKYLLLNDSTGEDAAQEFAAYKELPGGLGKDFAWSERQRGGKPGDENAWDTFRASHLSQIIDRARGVEVSDQPCWWTVWQSRNRAQRLIYSDPPYMRSTRRPKMLTARMK